LLTLSNDSERFGNFWDGFEGGVTYLNQSRRLNYGLGVFRLTELYDADLDVIRRERRVGATALALYPFSKFTRLEASLVVRHVSDHLLQNGTFRTVDLVSNFLTWVHDDARWTEQGPTQGFRAYVAAGYTRDLTSGDADFGTLLGEVRGYAQILPAVVWASRVQGQSSLGPDAQRFFLNGRAALRGYERRAASGQQTSILQNEVRFPILRGLTIAVPAPWMFPTVSGGAFADAAWVWEREQQNLLGSAGFSVWIGGGFLPALRWNVAWLTENFHEYTRRPGTQFTIDFNY
jgi:outer membrane protein assembly factor BamA